MKITVTNEDLARVALVEVQEFTNDKLGSTLVRSKRLVPGASGSFWIHARRRIVVDEIPEAAKETPDAG